MQHKSECASSKASKPLILLAVRAGP